MASGETDENGSTGKSGVWRYVPLLVVAAGLAFGYAMGWHRYFSLTFLSESSEMLRARVDAWPVMAPAIFFAAYVLAVAFSFPAASVLTIFGGFLFGWFAGGLMVAFAATLGATILFVAASSAFGGALRKRVSGRAARLAQGFEDNAFGYLLALRLAPVFPFFVVNIAPALFNVPVRTYVAATFIGILPGTFAYAWLGQGVGSVLDAARAAGEEPSVADLVTWQITLAFFLLALVAAIPTVVRSLRGRLTR
ncbi:MAG: TVP38/TMEM64 family protein [Rhizobiaceae bacterium]|nr:TVP38/TMEM64 family protein [Rhizobiaceae bacterium]